MGLIKHYDCSYINPLQRSNHCLCTVEWIHKDASKLCFIVDVQKVEYIFTYFYNLQELQSPGYWITICIFFQLSGCNFWENLYYWKKCLIPRSGWPSTATVPSLLLFVPIDRRMSWKKRSHIYKYNLTNFHFSAYIVDIKTQLF